jgi:hypothetical protein
VYAHDSVHGGIESGPTIEDLYSDRVTLQELRVSGERSIDQIRQEPFLPLGLGEDRAGNDLPKARKNLGVAAWQGRLAHLSSFEQ